VQQRLRDVNRAGAALDAQALLAHRGEVPAAGDEVHLVARRREAGAEVAADASGAVDRDFQG
jgi:hypothetical protein